MDLSTCTCSRFVAFSRSLILPFFYFQSGFSQDEMFEYFNCGVDYLLLIDHTKITIDDILRQLTETHTSSFFLGTFVTISKN
jgi:phosphoribosylaminoimidazole (AIR) synthetase